jgi:protein-tyrosine phosphatase
MPVQLLRAVNSVVGAEPQFPGVLKYHDLSHLLDMSHVDLLAEFPKCSSFIRAGLLSGVNCLVHCVYGQSRSTSVIVAYIMQALRCDADTAFQIAYVAVPLCFLLSHVSC